jgi:hypothetical protein
MPRLPLLRESLPARALHALRTLFRPRLRPLTAHEAELRSELAECRRRLDEHADEVRRLKTDLAENKAIIDVRDVELAHLSEVIARDRARTKAETAIANMQAAQAELRVRPAAGG